MPYKHVFLKTLRRENNVSENICMVKNEKGAILENDTHFVNAFNDYFFQIVEKICSTLIRVWAIHPRNGYQILAPACTPQTKLSYQNYKPFREQTSVLERPHQQLSIEIMKIEKSRSASSFYQSVDKNRSVFPANIICKSFDSV